MKKHIHFVFGLSLMALALAGCGKQEKTEETAKPKEDVAQPVVSERPPVQCDDATIKNGVVSLVQNELLSASVSALGNAKNLPALEQHLKSRLAQTQVDVQNVRYENGDCHGELHIALNPQDATTADQAFAKAKLPSLDERAVSSGVSLLGGHRLVSKFAYVVLMRYPLPQQMPQILPSRWHLRHCLRRLLPPFAKTKPPHAVIRAVLTKLLPSRLHLWCVLLL